MTSLDSPPAILTSDSVLIRPDWSEAVSKSKFPELLSWLKLGLSLQENLMI